MNFISVTDTLYQEDSLVCLFSCWGPLANDPTTWLASRVMTDRTCIRYLLHWVMQNHKELNAKGCWPAHFFILFFTWSFTFVMCLHCTCWKWWKWGIFLPHLFTDHLTEYTHHLTEINCLPNLLQIWFVYVSSVLLRGTTMLRRSNAQRLTEITEWLSEVTRRKI